MCPRSSDPFYLVTYNINGSLLLGHIVRNDNNKYIIGDDFVTEFGLHRITCINHSLCRITSTRVKKNQITPPPPALQFGKKHSYMRGLSKKN